jgi:hypothetical protein
MAQGAAISREGLSGEAGLCEMGNRPHAHCHCGLPMPPGGGQCALCQLEGLDPKVLRRPNGAKSLRWDGRSYPSRRRRRIAAPDPDGLIALLTAILRPPVEAGGG